MPDTAGQSGGDQGLEAHLESLLDEIEATQHEVEAPSPEPDPREVVAEPADHAHKPVTSEDQTPADQTLDVLSEVEADLGELMDAIGDLADPLLEHEPLIETNVPEPEAVSETESPAPALRDASDESASDEVDEALPGLDELSRSVEELLDAQDAGGGDTALGDDAPQAMDGPDPADTDTNTAQAVQSAPTQTAPAPAGMPTANAPAPSGDSLDDLLAAASEELLADEATDPAPLDSPEPEAIATTESEEQGENQDAGAELLDAVTQFGESTDLGDSSEMGDPAEAIAGMVEIPESPAASIAPEGETTPGVESDKPSPAAEPTPATVEELIVARSEPAPPTGRLAPLIIAWRATRRTLTPVAKAAAKHAGPAVAEAALAVSKPLREKPKSVRDTVGWIALYTAFLAMCLWVFALGFRSPPPADVGDSGVRMVNPDVPNAPVP